MAATSPSTQHLPGREVRGDRTPRHVPLPVALSVWSIGALVLGAALASGWGPTSTAEASPPLPPRSASALPDGRDEGGRLHTDDTHVRAELPWANPASLYGWGSLRLRAAPRSDDVHVHVIADAPTRTRRWASRCAAELVIDGHALEAGAEYVGARMKSGGTYDALRFDFTIDAVRRMAHAEHVEGRICGDRFELSEGQQRTLEAFVEHFDACALEVAPSVETLIESAPTDPELVELDPDAELVPS